MSRFSRIDRRRFLCGSAGFSLALPQFETFAAEIPRGDPTRRLVCFYLSNGVPMPLTDDPAFQDWSWFPHGEDENYTFTKCLEPLEPLRQNLTIFSGLSNPAVRNVIGHSNADQFLTGADTGSTGDYQNTISLDQLFASQAGQHTRYASLVLSTDGGTGSQRGAQTMSFDRNGRPIPAENKPKRIFDMLFVKSDSNAAVRLGLANSALDELLDEARSLKRTLSSNDQQQLDDYLQSVRDAEVKLAKTRRWLDTPLPQVDADHLNLDITPEDPRTYVQTMYELIYLAFKTDLTLVATYQLGKENGLGISDYLARAVGSSRAHALSHSTKKPGGWENFGKYCRFMSEEYGRFLNRLMSTPEPIGEGNMLDNTFVLFGSASSAFHTSRNYPIILAGGKNMGFQHGRYLKYGQAKEINHTEPGYRSEMTAEELPLSNLYLSMLQKLGMQVESFGGSSTTLDRV